MITERGTATRFQMPAFEQWRFLVSSLQAVKKACGVDSPHLRELEAAGDHDPDRRIVTMLGARASHVQADSPTAIESEAIAAS